MSKISVSHAKQATLDTMEKFTAPDYMSKEQYLEVLEELSTEIEMRIECVKGELAEESTG